MPKKLKLPIIKHDPLPPPVLSMEDYVECVEFNLKYTVDRAAVDEFKKDKDVLVRFQILPAKQPGLAAAERKKPYRKKK